MKSLKFLALLSFLTISTLFVSSCGDDTNPCDACDTATQTCVGEKCVTNETEPEEPEEPAIQDVTVSGEITENTTWTADRIWFLSNKVVVQSGATLTIKPGTIVKGLPGQKSLASALVVAKGGKIMAEGTADKPIIFTAKDDNIKVGETSGTNLKATDVGLWGGLIILGDAPVSAKGTGATAQIEGVPADIPNTTYGGENAADNSGVLTYISIRHGGITVADGNEINGLTLGGVGNGTKIENVEVISNDDDGIEFFGGTVDVTNAVVAYCADDALDLDQSYAGTITNAVVLQEGTGDKALEFDGPENSINPDGLFTLKNATLISKGNGAKIAGGNLKSKAQGTIDNCVWTGYEKLVKVADAKCNDGDAYGNLLAGKLVIKNSEVVGSFTAEDVLTVTWDDEKVEACADDVLAAKDAKADAKFADADNGNKVSATATAGKGADTSVFAWTWTKANGGF